MGEFVSRIQDISQYLAPAGMYSFRSVSINAKETAAPTRVR